MANGGPFGITPVDVGSALGFYQAGRQRRMQDILFKREEEKAQREQDRQEKMSAAWAKATKGGDQVSGGSAPGTPTGAAPSNPLLNPNVQQQLLGEIGALDGDEALDLMKQFGELNAQQRTKAKDLFNTGAAIAFELRNSPPEQRESLRAQRVQQMGQVSPELAGVLQTMALDDSSLEAKVNQGRDIEKILDAGEVKLIPVTEGGDVRPITPSSPFIDFNKPQTPSGEAMVSDDERSALIVQNASRTGEMPISELKFLQSALSGNKMGSSAMLGFIEKNKIAIRGENGQTGWIVNGRIVDNPEGR